MKTVFAHCRIAWFFVFIFITRHGSDDVTIWSYDICFELCRFIFNFFIFPYFCFGECRNTVTFLPAFLMTLRLYLIDNQHLCVHRYILSLIESSSLTFFALFALFLQRTVFVTDTIAGKLRMIFIPLVILMQNLSCSFVFLSTVIIHVGVAKTDPCYCTSLSGITEVYIVCPVPGLDGWHSQGNLLITVKPRSCVVFAGFVNRLLLPYHSTVFIEMIFVAIVGFLHLYLMVTDIVKDGILRYALDTQSYCIVKLV